MEKEEGKSKINTMLCDAFDQIKTISNSQMIMGEAIITSFGSTIIPVTKATIGFVVGGSEYCNLDAKKFPISYPTAGGTGGGVCLNPVGFLVESENEIKFIPASNSIDTAQKVVDILDKGISVLQGNKE